MAAGRSYLGNGAVGGRAETGAVSVIDGAHAPDQLPLDLAALDADFYVGNCHKWMLAPKGAAFFYAAKRWADTIRPPVIGWGNISEGTSALLLENEWQGTFDISAFLAVADAIAFARSHRWFDEVVPRCGRLLDQNHQIEVPVATGDHGTSLRVSVQAYNEASDLERLVAALSAL